MQVTTLCDAEDDHYDRLLTSDPHTLIYAASAYRNLLARFLGAKPHYLIAREGTEMRAALPCFLSAPGVCGPVLNSLPFYGSNGGVVPRSASPEARAALLDAFLDLAHEQQCASATIIVSPFDESNEAYQTRMRPDFVDVRIGQLTPLPEDRGDAEERLLGAFHQKTRNLVRKGERGQFTVDAEATAEAFDFLAAVHAENMRAIGGVAKPPEFFRCLMECLAKGTDYNLFTASSDGVPVAALLVLYFNRTVEYFTPVIKAEFRARQPLSVLIFRAMVDATRRGYGWWNWGGTWLSQDSVYHFKSRWGTVDRKYYYYVKLLRPELRRLSKSDLMAHYPYFFTIPFGLTRRENAG